MSPKNVAVIGSGNWGSCIARICGHNVVNQENFNSEVRMWVFEEMVDGKKLTEIINTQHENVKYLPGIQLPTNVVANPDLVAVGEWADILVFVLPHQFLPRTCNTLKGHLKPGAYGVSLIKGVHVEEGKGMSLLSDLIRESLGIDCALLMGANLAPEVAQETYCEATIGSRDPAKALTTDDEVVVELCGALKNVVATGAGFCDGLGYGDNTKAAVIRLGLMEMIHFIKTFYKDRGVRDETFFESCGMADLVTTCYGGRNRKLAEAFVRTGKPITQLEEEMLNGQKLQGPLTAAEVYTMLNERGLVKRFPLMSAVHLICVGQVAPNKFIDELREHPEHM
uniref:Glycerol-3-phosphate dehydrogenase [NAD(+)] n=1 Tax=Macrostomum lignano TaxID=282301 RepID=A0A1I8I478_9PLAT